MTDASNTITSKAAKALIATTLSRLGLPAYRLSARTIDFIDPARDTMIFVTVHGWQIDPRWNDLEHVARSYGFRVQARD